VFCARRHTAVTLVGARSSVVVIRTFGILLIQNSMWMHTERMRGVVSKHDFDRIAHFSAKNGSKQPEIRIFRVPFLQGRKSFVSIFAIDRFLVNAPNLVWARLAVALLEFVERMAHRFISPCRGVIPIKLVGSYIINARFAHIRLPLKRPTREKRCEKTKTALKDRATVPSIHGFSRLATAMIE